MADFGRDGNTNNAIRFSTCDDLIEKNSDVSLVLNHMGTPSKVEFFLRFVFQKISLHIGGKNWIDRRHALSHVTETTSVFLIACANVEDGFELVILEQFSDCFECYVHGYFLNDGVSVLERQLPGRIIAGRGFYRDQVLPGPATQARLNCFNGTTMFGRSQL